MSESCLNLDFAKDQHDFAHHALTNTNGYHLKDTCEQQNKPIQKTQTDVPKYKKNRTNQTNKHKWLLGSVSSGSSFSAEGGDFSILLLKVCQVDDKPGLY